MEETKVNTIFQMINDINVKYKENPYMIQRLETHLFNLPNILEQENKHSIIEKLIYHLL